MSELQSIQIELAAFRGRVDEALKHLATKDDLHEIKRLIEQRLSLGLTMRQKASLFTALITSITTAIMVLYTLIS